MLATLDKEEMIPHSMPRQQICHLITHLILLAAGGAGIFTILMGDPDDLFGNSVFALMVAAVLTNLAIMTSYAADKTSQNAVRIVWLLLCFGVLFMTMLMMHERDIGIVFGWGMLVLTFPLGWLLITIFGALTLYSYDFSPKVSNQELINELGSKNSSVYLMMTIFIIWLALVAVGYFQWFRIVPWIFQRFLHIRDIKRNATKNL